MILTLNVAQYTFSFKNVWRVLLEGHRWTVPCKIQLQTFFHHGLRADFVFVWPVWFDGECPEWIWHWLTEVPRVHGLWLRCWHGFFLLHCSHSIERFTWLPSFLPHSSALLIPHPIPLNKSSRPISCPTFDCSRVLLSPFSSVWTPVLLSSG